MPAHQWFRRFGPDRKAAWALSRDPIWEIATGEGGRNVTTRPELAGKSLIWRQQNGTELPFTADDTIRLWHPVETAEALSRAWRSRFEQAGVTQPFVQVGREVYRPAVFEMAGRSISAFAGRLVQGQAMMGLARVSGWRFGFQDELHTTLSGVRFTFCAGARAFPGAAGTGTTGNLTLGGPHDRLDAVPARILSEVMRKVDLLVAVGTR